MISKQQNKTFKKEGKSLSSDYSNFRVAFPSARATLEVNAVDKWYLLADDIELGPFNLRQLRHHPKFTPDAWVRQEGDLKWRRARDVAEFKELFADEQPLHYGPAKKNDTKRTDELTLDIDCGPPPILIWLLFVLLVLIYTCFRLWNE